MRPLPRFLDQRSRTVAFGTHVDDPPRSRHDCSKQVR
jgi:hypothetical protein